jgi:hypothetical protein
VRGQHEENIANAEIYCGSKINIFTKQPSFFRGAHYSGKPFKPCNFYIFICDYFRV